MDCLEKTAPAAPTAGDSRTDGLRAVGILPRKGNSEHPPGEVFSRLRLHPGCADLLGLSQSKAAIIYAALAYDRAGLRPFPVKGKTPAIKSTRALRERATFEPCLWRWWTDPGREGAGVAVMTGGAFPVVLDIDTAEGEALVERSGGIPEGAAVVKTRHGRHVYFAPEDLRCRVRKHDLGIDLRGNREGYAVLPPTPGYTWEILPNGKPLPPVPQWLRDLAPTLAERQTPREKKAPAQAPAEEADPTPITAEEVVPWREVLPDLRLTATGGAEALCPLHDDHDPSMTFFRDRSGAVHFCCRAECPASATWVKKNGKLYEVHSGTLGDLRRLLWRQLTPEQMADYFAGRRELLAWRLSGDPLRLALAVLNIAQNRKGLVGEGADQTPLNPDGPVSVSYRLQAKCGGIGKVIVHGKREDFQGVKEVQAAMGALAAEGADVVKGEEGGKTTTIALGPLLRRLRKEQQGLQELLTAGPTQNPESTSVASA